MKNKLQIAAVVLFIGFLWVPLLGTPFRFQQERQILRRAEHRLPQAPPAFSLGFRDVENHVEQLQEWYADSFAFRSNLMRVYNLAYYLVHSYSEGFFGRDGHLFRKNMIGSKLTPIDPVDGRRMSENLAALRRACEAKGIPCLFVFIPAKETVHPELAPRWIRQRDFAPRRRTLEALIRANGFPVLDLSAAMQDEVKKNGETLYPKYDHHWNLEGALIGYQQMIRAIKEFVPEARQVAEEEYVLQVDSDSLGYTKRLYLDGVLGEPQSQIRQIHLPPLRIIKNGKEQSSIVQRVTRTGRTDVFCRDRADRTVMFIRDSFFILPSQLFNHSFAHTVYLDHSTKGADPKLLFADDSPDLIVIALEEGLMGRYLARIPQ